MAGNAAFEDYKKWISWASGTCEK